MSEVKEILSYSLSHRTSRPVSIVPRIIALAIALMPLVAVPFAPSGRAYTSATGFVIMGFLCSPLNFCWSVYLVLRRGRRGLPFGISLVAALIAGVESAILAFALFYVARNGMPC